MAFRISADDSIPQHFEGIPLRSGPRALGWAAALAALAGGLALAALASGWVAELLGPLGAAAGVLALVAVVRCRRCEVTLGTTRIDVRAGPFHRVIPTGAVEAVSRRPATGWRRLFARDELILRAGPASADAAIPSRRPDEMEQALAELLRS